ncbi:MAG: FtsQ-type POTRA domain-containing protein [Chloroflexi bacterium]|nr:FtsQ-type POTRA domain-containing protein [Chloroflexota bacterium]
MRSHTATTPVSDPSTRPRPSRATRRAVHIADPQHIAPRRVVPRPLEIARVPPPPRSRWHRWFRGWPFRRSPHTQTRRRAQNPARAAWLVRVWVLVTSVLLGLMGFHPAFRVTEVQIAGLQRVPREQILRFGPVERLVGQPRFAVHPEPLAQALREAFPAFKQVHVSVPWYGPVRIEVQEREPVLVWESPQGDVWLDGEGVAFAIADEIPEVDNTLPRLTVLPAEGQPWPEPPNAEDIQRLVALYQHLPQGTKLVYHPLRGYGWYTQQGWPVFIGHQLTAFERQWVVYQRLYPLILARGWTPGWLDISNWQHPIVHLANEGTSPP